MDRSFHVCFQSRVNLAVDGIPVVYVHGEDDATADVEKEFVWGVGFSPGDVHSGFRVVGWVVFFVLVGGVSEVDVEAVVEGNHACPVCVCVLDVLTVCVSGCVWQVVCSEKIQEPERSEGSPLTPCSGSLLTLVSQTPQAARNL